MKKVFKERPMPDDIEFNEKDYGKRATAFVAAAGVAAAAGPYAGMTIAQKIKKGFGEEDFASERDNALVTAGGNTIDLNPLEVNDYVFGCRSGYDTVSGTRKAYEGIKARFGEYGAREVFGKSLESSLQAADIKNIAKAGYNCIVIPIRSFLLFKDEKINKKSLRVKRLDKIIKKCGKSGVYVILKLCDTPGFDPDADDYSIFGEGKQSLAHRNYLIKLWKKIGAYFKDEPAVFAYELLDPEHIDIEKYAEAYDALYVRAEKALREAGDSHILLRYDSDILTRQPAVYKGDRLESCIYCKPKDFIDIRADSFDDMKEKVTAGAKTELFTKLI